MIELNLEKVNPNPLELTECLDTKWLGYCNEFFNNEYTVYNLGMAIGAIAIILALASLINPTHLLRILFRKRLFITAFILLLANFIFVFIAAIVPYLPLSRSVFWTYHIFWEILAAASFFVSIIIFASAAVLKIKKIAPEKIEDINKMCIHAIAYRKEKLEAFAREIGFFINSIVTLSKNEDDITKYYSSGTLQLCADSELCKIIALKEPLTLQNIIRAFKKVNPEYELNQSFIREIVFQSLTSDKSILMRELNDSTKGLGSVNLSKGIISNLIFEEYVFVHNYNLLGQSREIYFIAKNANPIYRSNYVKFWEYSLKSFFNKIKNNLQYSESLRSGFKKISSFIKDDVQYQDYELYGWYFLVKSHLDENKDQILEYYQNQIPPLIFDDREEYHPEFLHRHNIFDVFAEGIYNLILASISRIKERNHNQLKRDILRDISYIIENDHPISKAIRVRFEKMMRQKIEENLKGYYPMMINAFFDIYGYQIFTNPKEISDFQKEILTKIAKKLPLFANGYIYNYPADTEASILEKNKVESLKILKDMLPEDIFYDHSDNTITYYYRRKRNYSKINLNEFLKNGEITPQVVNT